MFPITQQEEQLKILVKLSTCFSLSVDGLSPVDSICHAQHSIEQRYVCIWEKKKGSVSKKEGKRKDHSVTWNTVRQDCPKLLNVLRDSSLANRPPKICIPRSAKMKMKRMRSTRRALMEAMELTKLLTRLPMLAQYLHSHISVIPLPSLSGDDDLTWSL